MRPLTLSSYSRLKIAESSLIRFSAASSSFFLAAFLRLPPSSFCSINSFIKRASCFAAYTEQKKLAAAVNKTGANINNICRRINSTGHFYQDDIDELKEKLDLVWQSLKSKQSEEL